MPVTVQYTPDTYLKFAFVCNVGVCVLCVFVCVCVCVFVCVFVCVCL